MQLPMTGPAPVGHRHEATVIELAMAAQFNESRADRHSMLGRERQQLSRHWPVRQRFSQRDKLLARELSQMPVARDAAFGEDNNFDLLPCGVRSKPLDHRQI